MSHYDIFISYRRSSYDTANLIATRLRAAGYSVFFDVETLRSGKFNEQLFSVIQQCKDFLLVLPPEALDRCVNEDDWVRLEIMCALKHNKNIIPILLNGFQWPETMPSGMEELKNYQALTANSFEYFDMSLERLQKKYLHSKTRHPFVKAIKVLCIVALSIAIAISALWFAFSNLSKGVCEQYAASIVKDASAVYSIAEQNQMVMKEWTEYANAVKYRAPEKKISALKSRVIDAVYIADKNIKLSWTVDDQSKDISTYHAFLLALHGISVQDVIDFPLYCTLYYQDYLSLLQQIEVISDKPNDYSVEFISTYLSTQVHCFNAFYADLLSLLSSFPSQSLNSFRSISSEWIYFPGNIKLGETKKYYEDIVNNEMKLAEEELRDYQTESAIADVQADSMLEDLEEQMEQLQPLSESERELIKDLETSIEDAYSGLKENFSIKETDDQWTKWGKIIRWSKYMVTLIGTFNDADKDGYVLSTDVTPEIVFMETVQMLSDYEKQYSDSQEYVMSTRAFFKEVLDGKRDYAGILVSAINGDHQHPFLKVGDIITKYNGVKVPTLESLSEEYKKSPDGTITVDRLTAGHFTTISGPIADPSIVGFLYVTE